MNTPDAPFKTSGVGTVLKYTGIPVRWLDKRPKLPSRNWLIFLTVTSSITGLYIHDRRQCKKIRQEYVDRVKHFAEQPIDVFDPPRKVKVYGSKWPGDEDYDQSMKYFRKFVKPILVAAAVDYEMINGKRHGELARRIADDIKSRRRLDAGLDKLTESTLALPTRKSPEEDRRRELDGGIVIVGRPTFKEFMAGLQAGWTEGLERVDREELLARQLEDDGRFDEPEPPSELASEPREAMSRNSTPILFSPPLLRPRFQQQSRASSESIPISLNTPPPAIPPLPPLLLVSFTDYIGFKQIPLMIWDFLNQRHKVLAGARAAYNLIMQHTRPFRTSEGTEAEVQSDIDFDKDAESFYKKSTSSLPSDIEKARSKYYEDLPKKLVVARALARGERQPTKEEVENPPPTEVELRAERLKKELRWQGDLEGWDIIKPMQKVVWDERFKDVLRIFIDPPNSQPSSNASQKN